MRSRRGRKTASELGYSTEWLNSFGNVDVAKLTDAQRAKVDALRAEYPKEFFHVGEKDGKVWAFAASPTIGRRQEELG